MFYNPITTLARAGRARGAASGVAQQRAIHTEEEPMQTVFSHIQFNVQPANLPFYKDLLTFLGWPVIFEGEGFVGLGGPGGSLWFIGYVKPVSNDYDGPGMNHIALGAASQADVDTVVAYLADRGVPALFETPRHRPEFAHGPDQTYYQVMFESPDRILWEVVYTGPK
jgi:catechol 2,3-dioxygenase-like lactoylglutathione lyase family enzyme